MKSIVAGALATIATLGLLSACGDDVKLTAPNDSTVSSAVVLPGDVTIPPDVTLPAGVSLPDGSIPTNISVPEAIIDQMIAQFEAAGMKVDKACFTNLLKDESLRKMVEAGGAPNQDAIQKFFSCLST